MSNRAPIRSRGSAAVWLRAALWGAGGTLAAAAGLALLLGGVVAVAYVHAGGLGDLQWMVWLTLLRSILLTALLPQMLLALGIWLVVARVAPGVEGSWKGLLGGVPVATAVAFAPVGLFGLGIWEPQSWIDVVNTGLLVTAGSSAALLLARRAIPALRPGALRLAPRARP